MGEALPYRLQVFVNFAGPQRDHGWSEVLWLRTYDAAEAVALGRDYCNRRRLWYGSNVRTEYAMVSAGPRPLDTWAVETDDIATFPPNLPQPLPANDPWVGFYANESSVPGRWGRRTFKGVPDDWVKGMRCTRPAGVPRQLGGALPPITLGPAAAGAQAPLLLSGGQTLDLLQRSLLDAVALHTGFLSGGPGSWTVQPLFACAFTAVKKLDPRSDRGWFRVSAEPGACCVGGSWVSADFSFCGMCVGVVRAAYYAPCRWYMGGPVGGIRFYRIAPTNPVYYGQLRFGPKNVSSGYWNTQLAGEITSIPADTNRHFYDGTDVSGGARDGTHPHVTAAQAAGQAPWLWPAIFAA